MNIRLSKDSVSPDIRRKVAQLSNPRPVMEAIGLALVALTKRAFKDAALRPSAWAPKKDGKPATLRKSGRLWQSIRITSVEPKAVKVGSDARYAAAHQLGSKKRGLPPRPFFPFGANKKPTPRAIKQIEAAAKAKLNAILQKGS